MAARIYKPPCSNNFYNLNALGKQYYDRQKDTEVGGVLDNNGWYNQCYRPWQHGDNARPNPPNQDQIRASLAGNALYNNLDATYNARVYYNNTCIHGDQFGSKKNNDHLYRIRVAREARDTCAPLSAEEKQRKEGWEETQRRATQLEATETDAASLKKVKKIIKVVDNSPESFPHFTITSSNEKIFKVIDYSSDPTESLKNNINEGLLNLCTTPDGKIPQDADVWDYVSSTRDAINEEIDASFWRKNEEAKNTADAEKKALEERSQQKSRGKATPTETAAAEAKIQETKGAATKARPVWLNTLEQISDFVNNYAKYTTGEGGGGEGAYNNISYLFREDAEAPLPCTQQGLHKLLNRELGAAKASLQRKLERLQKPVMSSEAAGGGNNSNSGTNSENNNNMFVVGDIKKGNQAHIKAHTGMATLRKKDKDQVMLCLMRTDDNNNNYVIELVQNILTRVSDKNFDKQILYLSIEVVRQCDIQIPTQPFLDVIYDEIKNDEMVVKVVQKELGKDQRVAKITKQDLNEFLGGGTILSIVNLMQKAKEDDNNDQFIVMNKIFDIVCDTMLTDMESVMMSHLPEVLKNLINMQPKSSPELSSNLEILKKKILSLFEILKDRQLIKTFIEKMINDHRENLQEYEKNAISCFEKTFRGGKRKRKKTRRNKKKYKKTRRNKRKKRKSRKNKKRNNKTRKRK